MMKTNVSLLAVPEAACISERLDLRVLMTRAIKIEERMKKGVNLEDEQRRYQIICDRIEYLGNIISTTKKVEFVDLGDEYLELLLLMLRKDPEEAKSARIMANFCPTTMIEKQIERFERLAKQTGLMARKEVINKIKFYRHAVEKKWHVLEIQELSSDEEVAESEAEEVLRAKFLSIPMSDELTSTIDTNSFLALQNQIDQVIANLSKKVPAAVNFSELPHNTIAEVLNRNVYGPGTKIFLPVTYGDGSKARPFPIRCLLPLDKGREMNLPGPIINVGQLSGRHQEMDPKMNIYFFRNQEISTGKPAADIDEVAYQKAKAIFERLRKEGVYRIAYYQTGFQPAVVGFYRALTEELIQKGKAPPKLAVTPYYYFGTYKKGEVWI